MNSDVTVVRIRIHVLLWRQFTWWNFKCERTDGWHSVLMLTILSSAGCFVIDTCRWYNCGYKWADSSYWHWV